MNHYEIKEFIEENSLPELLDMVIDATVELLYEKEAEPEDALKLILPLCETSRPSLLMEQEGSYLFQFESIEETYLLQKIINANEEVSEDEQETRSSPGESTGSKKEESQGR